MEFFHSPWEDIKDGGAHGSTLGSLLPNIFICDLQLVLNNMYFVSDHVHGTQQKNTIKI